MTQNYKNKTGESKSPVFFDRGILDHLIYPACIITSKSILEYVNTPFLDLFGIDSEERKFDWPNVFNSEHKKVVAQSFVNALNGAFSSCTVEVKTAEGNGIPVDLLMQPVVNKSMITSVLVFIRVIEEEAQRGHIIHSGTNEAESNTVHYEFSPLPLIRFNRDLKIVRCSRSFEGTLGYTLEDMTKDEWCVIGSIFKYDAERIKNNIIEILKGNIPFKRIGEIKVKSKNGDEKVVNVIIYPVTRDKELAAIDLMMEDITRIRELKERLSAAKRLNLISDIGNGFIHSINNTINVILNQAQLLQIITEKDSVHQGLKQIEKYVHEVVDQLRRVKGFINERSDTGDEREESFDSILSDAIEFVRIHFKVDEEKRRKNLQIDPEPVSDIILKTDTFFFRELLIWAILKVSSYAEKKGKIDIELKKNSYHYITVSVRKGPSADTSNIVPFMLNGLSPSEIRNAAEKHNLRILEEESVELYSIKIILPQKMVIEKGAGNGGDRDYVIEERNIMIVEDESALQLILGNLFERMGNTVYITDNGTEAFEEFKKKNYDIVITDYDVAGMTGIELAARVKEISEDTLIILLSGWSIGDFKRYNSFIDLFMAKPFNIEDLIKGITTTAAAKNS